MTGGCRKTRPRPLQFGNAMHAALKAYFDGVRAGRAPDEETVIAVFLDEFSKAKIDEPLQRELYENDGREQLTAFLRSSLAHPEGEVLLTEHKFTIEISGARVRGRLDRLDRLPNGEVAVIDFKTGRAKTQEDADKSLQLSIYALAAQHLNYIPASLVFINTQNGVAVASHRSPAELRNAAAKVAEIAAKIAAGEFEPRPNGGCAKCSYNAICPAQEDPLPRPAIEIAAAVC